MIQAPLDEYYSNSIQIKKERVMKRELQSSLKIELLVTKNTEISPNICSVQRITSVPFWFIVLVPTSSVWLSRSAAVEKMTMVIVNPAVIQIEFTRIWRSGKDPQHFPVHLDGCRPAVQLAWLKL